MFVHTIEQRTDDPSPKRGGTDTSLSVREGQEAYKKARRSFSPLGVKNLRSLLSLGIVRQAETQNASGIVRGLEWLLVPFHADTSGVADHNL